VKKYQYLGGKVIVISIKISQSVTIMLVFVVDSGDSHVLKRDSVSWNVKKKINSLIRYSIQQCLYTFSLWQHTKIQFTKSHIIVRLSVFMCMYA
jgi:hypothetical protein